MSNSRNIADSAPVINFLDGVTSNVQTQLNTLTTAVGNVSVTNGSLTKTFAAGETADITLSSGVLVPNVTVTKEISQTGVTNSDWDAAAGSYTLENSAPSTSLSFVAGNVNTATYSNKTANLTGQSGTVYGLAFNTDGTKMFTCANVGGSDKIYEYALSTAKDVSTASFTRSATIAQTSLPTGLSFNADGTKMFVADYNGGQVYAYALSTGFDISTLSYTGTYDASAALTDPIGMTFNTDGTKMFLMDYSNAYVQVYNLSTGFDISTASYSTNFNTSNEATSPYGIQFNADGTKFFVCASGVSKVNQYNLTTGFDLSTASFSNSFSTLSSPLTSGDMSAIAFIGTTMYLLTYNNRAYQYELPFGAVALGSGSFASGDVGKTIIVNDGQLLLTATSGTFSQVTAPTSYATASSGSWALNAVIYDATADVLKTSAYIEGFTLANVTYTNKSISVSSDVTHPSGVKFNNDGSKMFVSGLSNMYVAEYNLSTPYDVTTKSSYTATLNTGPQVVANLEDFCFNNDGTALFAVSLNYDKVFQYTLTTGFDLSTASYASKQLYVGNQENQPKAISFDSTGEYLIIAGYQNYSAHQYQCSSFFDISTASYQSVSFSFASQDPYPDGLVWDSANSKLFMVGNGNLRVYEYDLASGSNISTASFVRNFLLSGQESTPRGIGFSQDGTQMYIAGSGQKKVFQYDTFTSSIPTGYQPCISGNIDTTYWTDLNSTTATNVVGDGGVFYAVSTDNKTTWKVQDATGAARSIVKNNSGTYQYNSNATFGSETWTNATTNTEVSALRESMAVAVNKMTSTTLNALSDANQIALGNDLDFAAILYIASGSTVPTYSGTALNYDANVLNQGVVLGTDYNWDAPATNKVRITTVGAGNFKVRVV